MPKAFCGLLQDLVLNGFDIGKLLSGILIQNTLVNCPNRKSFVK
jgi:hypothetical protein